MTVALALWEDIYLDELLFKALIRPRHVASGGAVYAMKPRGIPYAPDVQREQPLGHFHPGTFNSFDDAIDYLDANNFPLNYVEIVRNKKYGRKFLIWVRPSSRDVERHDASKR